MNTDTNDDTMLNGDTLVSTTTTTVWPIVDEAMLFDMPVALDPMVFAADGKYIGALYGTVETPTPVAAHVARVATVKASHEPKAPRVPAAAKKPFKADWRQAAHGG